MQGELKQISPTVMMRRTLDDVVPLNERLCEIVLDRGVPVKASRRAMSVDGIPAPTS
jgi:hypothetical protein